MKDVNLFISNAFKMIQMKKEHKKVMKNIKDIDSTRKSEIADFNIEAIKKASADINSLLSIQGNNQQYLKQSPFKSDLDISTNFYKRLIDNHFFEEIQEDLGNTSKSNKGSKLIDNVIKYNKKINSQNIPSNDYSNFDETFKAFNRYKDIMENGGQIITYDTETLGGVNSYGHQQLDFITELSATATKIGKDGSISVGESRNTLLGFDDKEYSIVKKRLESLRTKNRSEWSGADILYVNRLSSFSDENIKIKQNNFEFQIVDTKKATTQDATIENALKGAERYRNIGKQQEVFLKESGNALSLKEAKRKYVEDFAKFVYNNEDKKSVVIGQNINVFDKPVLEQTIGKSITPSIPVMDTYQLSKFSELAKGPGANLNFDYEDLNLPTKEFGPSTQDQYKHIFKSRIKELSTKLNIDLSQAHNAHIDEMSLMGIVTDNRFLKLFDANMTAANNLINSTSTEFSKDGLYYLNHTNGLKNGKTNPLSFSYSPATKTFRTFDGYEISKDGKITKNSFNGWGPKKNGLYSHEIYKVDLNKDEWAKQAKDLGISESAMDKFFDTASSNNEIYVLKSSPYIDKTKVQKKMGKNYIPQENLSETYYQIFNNIDDLYDNIGVQVAKKTENGLKFNDDVIKNLGFKIIVKNKHGQIEIKDISVNEARALLVNNSDIRLTEESAARKIREMNYEKIERYHRFTVENGYSISQKIAKKISHNETLDLNLGDEFMHELGFYDQANKAKRILPETIKNTEVFDKYVENNEPILVAINNIFNKMKLKDSFEAVSLKDGTKAINKVSNRDLAAKKNFLFKKAYNDIIERYPSNSNKIPALLTDSNIIDFYTFDLFPDQKGKKIRATVSTANSEITSLNLSRKNELIRVFTNNSKLSKNPNANISSNEAYAALNMAFDKINEDERFHGAFGSITKRSLEEAQEHNVSPSYLSSIMQEQLSKFVDHKRSSPKDSGFGLLYDRTVDSPADITETLKSINNDFRNNPEKTISQLESIINNSIGKMNVDITTIDSSGASDDLVDKIVNRYFMTFSKDDLEKGISGLTSNQKSVMRMQYDLAKSEATKSTKRLIDVLKDTNMNLNIIGSGKDAQMVLSQGNDLRTLNMHKYYMDNGIINFGIGDERYSLTLAFNVNNYIRNGNVIQNEPFSLTKNLTITNNVENGLDAAVPLKAVKKSAEKNKKNPLDALASAISMNENGLMEIGARKERNNFSNTFERAFFVDTNSIVPILPELNDMGLIDQIIEQNNIPKKYADAFKQMIIRSKNGKVRPQNIEGMLSFDSNMYFQLFHEGIMSNIVNHMSYDSVNTTEDVKSIMRNLSDYVKYTNMPKGFMTVSETPFPHGLSKYDDGKRPPQFQYGNAILTDTEKLKEGIEKGRNSSDEGTKKIFENLSIAPSTTTSAGDKVLYETKQGTTAGLTMQYLQMDTENIQSIFKPDIKKQRSSENNKIKSYIASKYGYSGEKLNEATEQIIDRIQGLSTYEQESLVNTRIAYLQFQDSTKQLIDGKKKLLINHNQNLINIKEMTSNVNELYPTIDEEGHIVYKTGYEVKRGSFLGYFGDNESPKFARDPGVMRYRYYKDGKPVSEEEVNNFIDKINKDHKMSKTNIIDAVENEFDSNYEVIKKFQSRGVKVFTEATEKTTADSLDMGLGTIDKELISILEDKINISDSKGQVFSKDYIEEFIRPKFGDEIADRILKERFMLSDLMANEYEEFSGVGQILLVNQMKHSSVSLPLSTALNKISAYDKDDREKVYNAMFGKDKWAYGKNGKTINTDKSDSIKIGNFTAEDLGGDKKLADRLNKDLKEVKVVTDKNGNVKGHYGIGHVTQMYDDTSGTYAGMTSDIEKYYSLKRDLMSQIDDLKAKKKSSPNAIKNLKDRMLYADKKILELKNGKGVKYSSDMDLILRRQTINSEMLERAQYYLSKEDFDKTFGYLYKGDKINEQYLNKSILKDVTKNFRDKMFITPGEKLLNDVKNDPKKQYLIKSFGSKELKTTSVDKAEMLYSYAQGVKAIDFNNQKQFSTKAYNELVSNDKDFGFKLVDITKPESRLDIDINGQGDIVTHAANNPYNQNLMIKYGPKKSDVIAIPRMPEKHFDDSITKTDHIRLLKSLQDQVDKANDLNLTEKERAQAQEKVNAYVQMIKDAQKKDITSKTGLAGQLFTNRTEQSYFGKTSSRVIDILGQDIEKVSNRDQFYKDLVMANGRALDTYKINGKSILKHLSEGKAYDFVELSQGALESMGYLDKEFMKNFFKNVQDENMAAKYKEAIKIASKKNIKKNQVGVLRESMLDYLHNYGDSFINVRYPEIQEGSDKVVMGFYNPTLKENEIRVAGLTQRAMNGDNDGDIAAVIRVANKDKESYMNYLVGSSKTDTISLGHEVNTYMTDRAINQNIYWLQDSEKQLAKEKAIGSLSNIKLSDGKDTSSIIEAVSGMSLIDGRIYKSQEVDNKTLAESRRLNEVYKNEIKTSMAEGNHDKVMKQFAEKYQGEELDKVKKEYVRAFQYQVYQDELIAKSAIKSIGEINVTNSKISRALSSIVPKSDKDYDYKTFLVQDIHHRSEQAAISAKSSIKGLDPDRAKINNELSLALVTGQGNEKEIKQNLKEWLSNYVSDDIDLGFYYSNTGARNKIQEALGIGKNKLSQKEFSTLIEKNPEKGESIKKMLINDYVDSLSSLRNKNNIDILLSTYSIGQSQSGVFKGIKDMRLTKYDDLYSRFFDKLKNMKNPDMHWKGFVTSDKLETKSFGDINQAGEVIKNAAKEEKSKITEDLAEGASDLLKKVKGSKIALGALAIGAGIMAAGFVGGKPRPADTQAMEEAQDDNQNSNGPILADSDLQPAGTNRGYVININAKTDKGRDHAINAIQQAFSSQGNSNINISMNITDKYGNINDRDIEKQIADIL